MLRILLAAGVAMASWGLAAPPASAVCNGVLYAATGKCDVCSVVTVPLMECAL